MKTRKTLSIIFALLPIALLILGFFGSVVWPLNAEASEGWSFVIFLVMVLPIIGAVAIPLSIAALCLSGKEGPLFVKILSVLNLICAVVITVYGIIAWTATK